MHRVAQGIEYCAVAFGNRRVQLDNIGRGNLNELRERSVLVDSNDFYIRANVRFAHAALMAMPAIDVHLRADEVSGFYGVHFGADSLYHPAKFVSQRYRWLDSSLRP